VRVLGLDTATAIASVGLASDSALIIERHRPVGSSHARCILPLIDEVLRAAELRLGALDLLAVSIGPGSFTGLRIGLATIKGLALGCGLPVVGVPTLQAYAAALGPRPGTVWPVLDARKGEVYAAGYRWSGEHLEELAPPAAMAPASLAALLTSPCTLVGDGVDAYGEVWPSDEGFDRRTLAACPPNGAVVARLGAVLSPLAPGDLEPRYCRPSEAEVRRRQVVATAVCTR
jgi:tRNA threonylcarbamoyladenosine biosynthesis protein TsaB